MRYINAIYPADLGERWTNQRLLEAFEPIVAALPVPEEESTALRDFVRFQLVGERARRTVLRDWTALTDFRTRAEAFEAGAEEALDSLAEQLLPAAEAAGVCFDAVIATTATGNLMPGISYRLAHRLGACVRPDSMLVDLANVGCTGSLKALNLAHRLDSSFRNILVAAVELPSTLVDTSAAAFDLWQGNCTFGDGAAALWIADEPTGERSLAVEEMRYWQRSDTGLGLIRWAYRSYYSFALGNEKTFERDVRQFVVDALNDTEEGWRDEPRWAIHPAGIALLVRISRKLGIPGDSIQPSVKHYREYSNMSSASVLHILRGVAETTPAGGAINLLSMGAGFNVLYGRVRRVT